jgi:hypothetical protein
LNLGHPTRIYTSSSLQKKMLAARVSECLAAKRNNAQNAFIVTSDEVRQFSGEFLIEAILLEFAIAIKSSARPPISNFFVSRFVAVCRECRSLFVVC